MKESYPTAEQPDAVHPRWQDHVGLPGVRLQSGDVAHVPWYLKALQLAVRGIFRFFFRVRVRGLKNVPDTPVIICANHLSWADPFLVLLFLPAEPRIYVLSDHHAVASTGFRHRMVDFMGMVVPLDPGKEVAALKSLRGLLQRGGSLLIFPEGFSSQAQEGTLQPLRHGASYLSVLTGVPVLPVGVTGTKELWLRRRITMRVGKPISPAQLTGDRRTRAFALTTKLEKSLQSLLPGDREQARVKLLRNWLTNLFA